MSIRVITWDNAKTTKEINKRFQNASDARRLHEDKWIRNESTVYSTSGAGLSTPYTDVSSETSYLTAQPGPDSSDADWNTAYAMKNLRYIHAQMSANPPSVAMRPTSSDEDDRRKADAADRLVRWAMRHYILQEKMDQLSLNCLLYGTGVMKTVWDSSKGAIVEFDQETEEMKLEGDIDISVPFLWNLYFDPDARSWDECKWVFEKIYIDYEEACAMWPGSEEMLEKARVTRSSQGASNKSGRNTQLDDNHYNCVELLEFWETGLPTNGYLGRYCLTTINGEVLEKCRPSPFRFRKAGAVSEIEASDIPDEVKEELIARLPEQASLPYHLLTDIDIPNMIWGRSAVEYASQLQDNLTRLDTAVLDNIQAHGAARLVVQKGAGLQEDALSNSPWDVTELDTNQPPFFVEVPSLMPEMTSSRNNLIQGINDVMGVNEAMFGQQSREQSGASMQYATNQGNMIRRRLFNKYVLATESIYRAILNLIRRHWSVDRTIHVLGKEKALEAIDIKGADIDGGYDVVGEYGVTLSLDPITRREEIMSLQPLFEKAGVPMRTSLRMMKLNELEGLFDRLDLAGNRQKEIFDAMIATGGYIAPKKYRDHANMIAWALDYFMTQEFEALPNEIQQLCEQHIEARGQLAAEETGGAAPAGAVPQPPGPPGSVPAGPLPEQAGVPGPLPG